MHIQVINFGINVSHEDFVSGATELAPVSYTHLTLPTTPYV